MLYDPISVLAIDGEGALLPSLVRSKKTIAQIRKLVDEKGAVLAYGYGHSIYRCSQCSRFYGRFFIHLDHRAGSYEIEYRCYKCRIPLKRLNIDDNDQRREPHESENLHECACPKCGARSLWSMSEMVIWD